MDIIQGVPEFPVPHVLGEILYPVIEILALFHAHSDVFYSEKMPQPVCCREFSLFRAGNHPAAYPAKSIVNIHLCVMLFFHAGLEEVSASGEDGIIVPVEVCAQAADVPAHVNHPVFIAFAVVYFQYSRIQIDILH